MCVLILVALLPLIGYAGIRTGWHYGMKAGRRQVLERIGKRR